MSEHNELQIGVARVRVRAELNDYDRRHVPDFDEDYQIDDAMLEALAVCAADDLPALLVGPTGCGKSSGVQLLAALMEQPVRRVNLHGDTRASDLIGEKVLDVDPKSGQATVQWRDGVLPDAMRRGHWLILDEFDATPASIAMVLQAVLEPGHKLVLAANHGEVVDPDPNFRIFATANTLGRGDSSGMYAGTNLMNEATLDRFVVMSCGYPKAKDEAKILTDKCKVDAVTAERMVSVAGLVRSGYDKGEAFCTFSTRRLLAWARLAARFNDTPASKSVSSKAVAKAYKLAVHPKLGTEDAQYVGGVVQRVMGITL
jgi:cobaltochelatase CobS